MCDRRVNREWQRNLALTAAVTRAFVFADAGAAVEVDHAASLFEDMLARAMSGGEPTEEHHNTAGISCDVWLANLTLAHAAGASHGVLWASPGDRNVLKLVVA